MASVDTLSVGEVFANPTRYTSLLNRCGIGLPGPGQNLTLPTTGNFDFICLNLLNITTGEQCKVFAGASYKLYSGIDEVWKIPLVLLLIQFARSPLVWHTHLFTLFHLLGDPINTIASLLYTLAACQQRAIWFQISSFAFKRPVWKLYALILTSYDECGKYGNVTAFIQTACSVLESETQNFPEVQSAFHNLANSLAADRQTKTLPIVYGLFLFIQAFGFAFYKTNQSEKASLQYPNGKWVNIEAHSIAFSALLLWLIPAVYFSSIIGVSQMDEEIPRKLEHFQKQLKNLKMQSELRKNSSGDQSHSSLAKFPSSLSAIPVEIQFDEIDGQNSSTISGIRKCREQLSWLETRTMYSCQPALLWDIRRLDGRPLLSGRTRVVCHTVSWILVTSSFAIAIGISYGVPPHGNMCRPRWQLAALFAWVGSWVLDFPIMRWVPKGFDYWFLFVKDLIAGSFIVALILVVQGGILNKCSCYSSPKDKTMINPLDPLVAQRLDELFNHQWLGITVAGIAIQLVISAFMSWWYITAFRVYLQRNDGKSNFYPVWKEGRPYLVEWLERLRFLKQSRARSKQDIEVNSFQNYSREGTDHETIGLMQTLPVHPNREPEQSGQEAANINVGVTSAVEITEQDGIPKLGVKRAVKTY